MVKAANGLSRIKLRANITFEFLVNNSQASVSESDKKKSQPAYAAVCFWLFPYYHILKARQQNTCISNKSPKEVIFHPKIREEKIKMLIFFE